MLFSARTDGTTLDIFRHRGGADNTKRRHHQVDTFSSNWSLTFRQVKAANKITAQPGFMTCRKCTCTCVTVRDRARVLRYRFNQPHVSPISVHSISVRYFKFHHVDNNLHSLPTRISFSVLFCAHDARASLNMWSSKSIVHSFRVPLYKTRSPRRLINDNGRSLEELRALARSPVALDNSPSPQLPVERLTNFMDVCVSKGWWITHYSLPPSLLHVVDDDV